MVDYSQFSERIFEFAFNAEFARRHAAVLATCPSLPSLQAEKALGYDVLFELKRRGGGNDSVFLQHKVVRFVTRRCGSNKHFFDFAGGPYFAFRLDIDQYNLIHGLAAVRKRKIYYCAPLCTTRRKMDDIFIKRRVCRNSVWIDVAGAGPITDGDTHTIIYSGDGSRAAVFSKDAQKLAILDPASYKPPSEPSPRGLDRDEAERLYEDVYSQYREWWPTMRGEPERATERLLVKGRIPPFAPEEVTRERLSSDATRSQLIEETAELMARYYQVSWFMLANNPPN